MVFCQIPNASPALSQAPADAAHMDTTPNRDRLVCAATLRVRARTYIVVSRPKLTRPLLHFLLNPCLVHHPSTSVDTQALGLQQELESLKTCHVNDFVKIVKRQGEALPSTDIHPHNKFISFRSMQ